MPRLLVCFVLPHLPSTWNHSFPPPPLFRDGFVSIFRLPFQHMPLKKRLKQQVSREFSGLGGGGPWPRGGCRHRAAQARIDRGERCSAPRSPAPGRARWLPSKTSCGRKNLPNHSPLTPVIAREKRRSGKRSENCTNAVYTCDAELVVFCSARL